MKRPSRLLYIIESASGGSLNYLGNLTRMLEPDKWQVTVIYSRRPDSPFDLHSVLPHYVNCIETRIPSKVDVRRVPTVVKTLRNIIEFCSPSLVHLHSSMAGAVGRLAMIGNTVPLLYTPHGFAFYKRDINPVTRRLYWGMEYLLCKLKPCTLLVGSDVEYRDATRLAGEAKTILVYNGVAIPSQPSPVPANGRVVIAGRITAAKAPSFLLDVVALVQKDYPDVEFIWVGDGELRSYVEREAGTRGLHLTITGWMSKTEVREALSQCAVYIQTSSWEALPLALLEAMALARPVVASQIEAHEAVIHQNDNGFLASNQHEFAECILRFLHNPGLANRMGKEAYESVTRKFSEVEWSRAIEKIYEELLTRA